MCVYICCPVRSCSSTVRLKLEASKPSCVRDYPREATEAQEDDGGQQQMCGTVGAKKGHIQLDKGENKVIWEEAGPQGTFPQGHPGRVWKRQVGPARRTRMGGGHGTHVCVKPQATPGGSWGCWRAGFKVHRRKGMKDEAGQISKGDQTLSHSQPYNLK